MLKKILILPALLSFSVFSHAYTIENRSSYVYHYLDSQSDFPSIKGIIPPRAKVDIPADGSGTILIAQGDGTEKLDCNNAEFLIYSLAFSKTVEAIRAKNDNGILVGRYMQPGSRKLSEFILHEKVGVLEARIKNEKGDLAITFLDDYSPDGKESTVCAPFPKARPLDSRTVLPPF
ncbi:hypothetical protein [Chromobacterium amazonense]|uniref:DUF4124 domain-containing protein n=1 Tax=Chromobacterium amazonense TaxID=1382803 RepID=A0ABU8UY80_9NEIS|nr:hypothetical protein [Chromobacterium amazonense]MDQ4540966.1 hypothetical protein [Chromobacterium amazonense]